MIEWTIKLKITYLYSYVWKRKRIKYFENEMLKINVSKYKFMLNYSLDKENDKKYWNQLSLIMNSGSFYNVAINGYL